MSGNLRSTAVAVLTALVLAAALVPAVAADCNDGLLSCDVRGSEQTDASPVTLQAITTALPLRSDPTDAEVYSRAIGTYYSLLGVDQAPTGQPLVGLALRSTTDAAGTEVVESTVAIRVSRNGEPGWKVISRVVSAGAADQQAIGITAVDGEGSLDGTSGSTATLTGLPAASLAIAPGQGSGEATLEAFTTRSVPTFGVTPVVTGRTPWRITQAARPLVPVADAAGSDPLGVDGVTEVTAPTAGEVTYTVNPDLNKVNGTGVPAVLAGGRTLADMVVVEGTAPGLSWATDALLVEQADNTEDARGPLPVAPPPLPTDQIPTLPTSLAVAVEAHPDTGQAGYINNENVIVEGSQLYVTTTISSHPISCATFEGELLIDKCGNFNPIGPGDVRAVDKTEDLPPGVHYYVCAIHSGNPKEKTGMWGSITVVG